MKKWLLIVLAVLLCAEPAYAQNPNVLTPSPQTLTTQSSGVTDCTRNTTCAFWDIGQQRSASIQVSGTFSGTMTFEATSDGSNWNTVTLTKLSDASAVTTATAAGQYSIVNSGIWLIRARATTWASGTANLTAVFGNGTIPLIPVGSEAPASATFWLATANAALPNASVLGALGSGLVLNATTTGIPSIYAGSSCTNQFVRSLSAVGAAACASVSLTADVTGTLPVANGGTSLATLTAHAIYVGNTTSAPTALSVGATGTVLAGATGADPAFTATPTLDSIVGSGGQSLVLTTADVTEIYRSTNPQLLYLYNTRTSGSNYERGGIGWASNSLQILTNSAGAGGNQFIQVAPGGTATWRFHTDGSLRPLASGEDVGTLALPARTVYASTSFNLNGTALVPSLTGTTGSIGGGALIAGACTSGTVAVTNSTTSMAVGISPNTYPGDGVLWYGYVSANGTVTVKVCGVVAVTPTASTYNVRVIQ
jgi:hypothetical protein